jgi:hypothetical protein
LGDLPNLFSKRRPHPYLRARKLLARKSKIRDGSARDL